MKLVTMILTLMALAACMVKGPRGGEGKFDNEGASGQDSTVDGNSLYQKYRFSRGSTNIDIVIKIDRHRNGDLIALHTIDPRDKEPISSIPLERSGSVTPNEYRFQGDSFAGQGGTYTVSTDRSNKPPEIDFINFPRENGEIVIWRGKAMEKITKTDWGKMADKRPEATFDEPRRLPKRQQDFLDTLLEELLPPNGKKLKHNRLITIGGKNYYGAVYEIPGHVGRCSQQIWGLDNVDVVRFLDNHPFRITKDYMKDDKVKIPCMNGSVELQCDPRRTRDQVVLRVENAYLIFEHHDGSSQHIDSDVNCRSGKP